MKESQMTTLNISMIGALSAKDIDIKWEQIVSKYQPLVKRLQMRIAKAVSLGKHGKVKALQWLLTHSFAAKILAVKRVTSNSGKRTAGIDGKIWSTSLSKIKAISKLNRKGYKASPLRRVYIPKKNGKRALGIPTIRDRAMQALHLLALEPVAELTMEPNYYGFRPYRSTADAIEQCFNCLSMKHHSKWILEGDIKSCFDKINHNWLINNISMDKQILNKWLKSGIIDRKSFYPTDMGTPQGAICSPTLANLTLNGMEILLKDISRKYKLNVVVYADDFIITAKSKEILQQIVKPRIESFLHQRRLKLSQEKTSITHINQGFDFLGFNIRKYKGKLLIKPSKSSIKKFLKDVRDTIKSNKSTTALGLINLLNPKIRGWMNYYRHVVSSRIFSTIDCRIFQAIWKWAKRRHPNKNTSWLKKKYFRSVMNYNWVFYAPISKQGKKSFLDLIYARNFPITRHVKIIGKANPYDPKYVKYFMDRKKKKNLRK